MRTHFISVHNLNPPLVFESLALIFCHFAKLMPVASLTNRDALQQEWKRAFWVSATAAIRRHSKTVGSKRVAWSVVTLIAILLVRAIKCSLRLGKLKFICFRPRLGNVVCASTPWRHSRYSLSGHVPSVRKLLEGISTQTTQENHILGFWTCCRYLFNALSRW